MKVVSVNIGKKKSILWKGRHIETGIFKHSVNESIFLDEKGVRKDQIIDIKNHGGIDKAVYGYSYSNYDYFKKWHHNLNWEFGMFGENLTFSNLEETKINIGNIYKLGSCKLQVTQPRQPCFKLGIRFNDHNIISQFWKSTKCGVYFKVLKIGEVKVGDQLELIEQSKNINTIADAFELIKSKKFKNLN